jgi:hypothetical protein
MYQRRISRRGPLLTLGLGISMLITAGVMHAPATDASTPTGAGDAPSGDGYVFQWRSSGQESAGENTPPPVPDEGAVTAPEPETGDEHPAPVPDEGAVTAPEPENGEGTTDIPEHPVSVADEATRAPDGGADAAVPEASDPVPSTAGTVDPEAPSERPVIHAGPGPAEPTEGAITLIDPQVIERPEP